MDFESLLQAARLGAEWAWTVLYREYSPVIAGYLRAHGARRSEDVLGEVFVQLVRKLPDFEGDESGFRAWIFTIARNRIIDEWRRDSRGQSLNVFDEDAMVALAPTGNAEEDAMRRFSDERVKSILADLSTDQRDVLFLRLFSGLTIDEIAQVVGKRPGAVKGLQARGLAAIRRAMSKEAVTL